MKKLFGLGLLLGLVFGANAVLFAQDGQNPPPPMQGRDGKFNKRGGPDGPGRGEMRGMRRGGGPGEMRGGPGERMRGGFGISDEEIFKLNLSNEQKVKLFDFRKRMFDERENARKNFKPGEGMKPEDGISREEMRQLMSAKNLGTLTPEQKAKLDAMEAKRKEMMEKRKTEMDQMKAKMDQAHQEFLNIFTPEQRKQIEQIRADHDKERQERMKQMQEQRKTAPPQKPNN